MSNNVDGRKLRHMDGAEVEGNETDDEGNIKVSRNGQTQTMEIQDIDEVEFGPYQPRVSEQECKELRRKYHSGKFKSYNEAGDSIGVTHRTAWNHINGECNHE